MVATANFLQLDEQDRLVLSTRDLSNVRNYDTFAQNTSSMTRLSDRQDVPIVYIVDRDDRSSEAINNYDNNKEKTYRKYLSTGLILSVILSLLILSLFLFFYFSKSNYHPTTLGNQSLKDYANYSYGICSSYSCGKSLIHSKQLRIVGGQTVAPYSWPWQVALFKRSGTGYYLTCGASLISDQWILTAAHCFQYDVNPNNFLVKLGVYNKNANDEPGEMVLRVADIRVHPEFDIQFMYNDIALIKLYFPIQCNDHVVPVCLPEQSEPLPPVGTYLTVTGWGTTEAGGGMTSTVLRQVSVPLISETACRITYDYTVNYSYNFCAGYKLGGKDTCQGDSGGPIVYRANDKSSWIQIGITSWGNGCAEPLKPGVYSKVSTYIEWIKTYTDVQHYQH